MLINVVIILMSYQLHLEHNHVTHSLTHYHLHDFNVKSAPPQIYDLDFKNIICASCVCSNTFII